MKRIAIYSRKSILTDKGESIQVQIKLCKDYFNEECEFIEFIDEGFSGGNTNRPAFKKMMELVRKKQIDAVALYKIDRISRNIVDFFSIYEGLEKHDVKLISITERFDTSTPTGVMLMTILAGFAQMERMNIKQRVKDNMRELALRGCWTGGNAPIGYKSIKVVELGKKCSYLEIKNNEEVEIIKEIYSLSLQGISARKIADKINSRYGLATSQKRICNILYSPTYTESSEILNNYLKLNNFEVSGEPNGFGYLTYQKTKINKSGSKVIDRENKTIAAVSKHKAIIDNNTWLKVQERLKTVTQEPRPRKSQFTFLAHLVKCGYCNTNMFVDSEPRKTEPQRFFRKKCKCDYKGSSRLTIERAERNFINGLIALSDIKTLECLLKNTTDVDYTKEIKYTSTKIMDLDKKINGLTEKFAIAEGELVNIMITKLNKMITDKKELEYRLMELERLKNTNKDNDVTIKTIEKSIKKLINDIKANTLSKEDLNIEISRLFEGCYWSPIEEDFKIKFKE